MAVVSYKDKERTTQTTQASQVFKGFSTQGREFLDSKLYDIELVKQDLLNHFNIRKGEKLENPEFGTDIWNYLFDPLDDETKNAVISDVESVVNYDPRVTLDQIEVQEFEQGLSVKMTVLYIGYAIGETINLLFDSEQGLLQGPGQFFSASSGSY
jgi:phage baseplate assembly protein W